VNLTFRTLKSFGLPKILRLEVFRCSSDVRCLFLPADGFIFMQSVFCFVAGLLVPELQSLYFLSFLKFLFAGNAPNVFPQAPIMSHNYPYRQPASDSDLRPDPRRYGAGADRDFYRQPQESFSSSSRSSAALQSAHGSQDGVLSLLSSCGLEPEDLSVLAKLPEDILTVESLPQILKHIKGKKGSVQPFPPRSPEDVEFTGKVGTIKPLPTRAPTSPLSSSASFKPLSSGHWPSTSTASRDWEQLRRQPVQYPLHLISSSSAPPESQLDRWAGHKTTGSVRSPPSSSRRAVDHDHRPRPPSYGKEGSSFSTPGSVDRARPSRLSTAGSADYRSVPPRLDEDRRDSRSSYSSRGSAPSPMPSKKQALDFHGTSPAVFPYSCSLCDITVLSEKVSSPVLLQYVSAGTITNQTSGKMDQGLPHQLPDPIRTEAFVEMGSCDQAKDVVKFYSSSDKAARKEKIEFSISNAFSFLQRHLPSPNTPSSTRCFLQVRSSGVLSSWLWRTGVKQNFQSQMYQNHLEVLEPSQRLSFYTRCKTFESTQGTLLRAVLCVTKRGAVFSLFSAHADLLQSCLWCSRTRCCRGDEGPPGLILEQLAPLSLRPSSQVVSFTPAPTGEDGRSDLISIAKRFGEPLYTLFLPSKAFVEMKLSAEAQKLVDYYSSNLLRINTDTIQVSFSSEYRTLMKKYFPDEQKLESFEANKDKPELQEMEETEANEEQKPVTEEKKERTSEMEQEEPAHTQDEEAEFPVDLENCITLDEVKTDDEDEGPPADGHSEVRLSESEQNLYPTWILTDLLTGPFCLQGASESSRVLFFSTMPLQYTDMEFITLMRGFGTVVHYLLIQNRQQVRTNVLSFHVCPADSETRLVC
ncbi:hypothetical protein XENOCAPTIV_017131, partial [Xenoophorus captivus]